ncbi:LysR family transcriptional regulator [bacterium]|nr:MAG: LysR family transcriptional regulator [bacterium]
MWLFDMASPAHHTTALLLSFALPIVPQVRARRVRMSVDEEDASVHTAMLRPSYEGHVTVSRNVTSEQAPPAVLWRPGWVRTLNVALSDDPDRPLRDRVMAENQLNLNHLISLSHVVETGSYSKAAERLGLSQPEISQQIEELTQACGLPLVTKHGRTIAPTPLGQELARVGRRIRTESEHAAKIAADHRAGIGGRLTVGASLTAGAFLAPLALANLRRTHPALVVSLQIGYSGDIVEAVIDELADVGIIEVPVQRSELLVSPFYRDVLRCIVSADHPLAGRTVTAASLKDETLILRELGSGMREAVSAALGQAGLTFEHTIEIGSAEATRAAVGVGLGITWISALTQMEAKGLAVISISDLSIERAVSVIRRRDREPTPAARAFIEALEHAALDIGENQ